MTRIGLLIQAYLPDVWLSCWDDALAQALTQTGFVTEVKPNTRQ